LPPLLHLQLSVALLLSLLHTPAPVLHHTLYQLGFEYLARCEMVYASFDAMADAVAIEERALPYASLKHFRRAPDASIFRASCRHAYH